MGGNEKDQAKTANDPAPDLGQFDIGPAPGRGSSSGIMVSPVNPQSSGLAGNPFGAPVSGFPGPFQPNASKHGIPYTVPTIDYKQSVTAAAPPLDAEMPVASFTDPGAIPGWKTVQPAKTDHFGPFEYTTPAKEVVIAGEEHSNEMKDAWFAYKNDLIRDVGSAWDTGPRHSLNSYAMQKNGNAELDETIKTMGGNDWNMKNVGAPGAKGTVSDQSKQTNIHDGHTASQIGGAVAGKGDAFKADLGATAAAGRNGVVAGPVGALATNVRTAQGETNGAFDTLDGLYQQAQGAESTLSAKADQLEILDLKTKVADEKDKKKEMENGQAALKKYAPEIAPLHKMFVDNKKEIGVITKMIKKVPGALEGDPMAILAIGKSLLDIAKWDAIAKQAQKIKFLNEDIESKYQCAALKELSGATNTLAGLMLQVKGAVTTLRAKLVAEKTAYDKLAEGLETNWKGGDKNDGAMAARALRALPIVRKVLRTLFDIKDTMPALPDAGTRASQGFALATKGVNAPGAAQMLKVAGWITGAPKTVDPEVAYWQKIETQLSVVTDGLDIARR